MSRINIFQGNNDLWYFNVQSDNGELISQSEGYASKANAERGADALRRAVGELVEKPFSGEAPRVKDEDGEAEH